MATPQWVLLQRRIEPTQKSLETQYEKNARKRQKEAVRSAKRRGFLKHLDQQMILEVSEYKPYCHWIHLHLYSP